MKIIYLLSRFEPVGGQELYLARRQMLQGHDVLVVSSSLHYPLQNMRERYTLEGLTDEDYDRTEGPQTIDGLRILRLKSAFHYDDFVYVRGIKKVLQDFQPDVVFGHEPRTIMPILGAWYKQKFGYVYFLDTHDFFHKVQNHRWWQRALRYAEYFWWRKWFVLYALKRADRIIAVAGECRTFLEKRHGISPERINDLPLGVETDYYIYREENRFRSREELGYTGQDVVLIFSGYMFRRKAIESLIDALSHLKDLPLKLLLVGEGPEDYIRELKKHAAELHVDGQIRFFGFASRKRMEELYCAADIGVWPGNNTLAILEAMSCRLPLVIADMQLSHLAGHENGILVPYADVGALEKALLKLATDRELRVKMGEKGAAAVRTQYSYAVLADQLSSWMEEAIREKRSARRA